jgi:tetratricopeptide (TPR) repeat protein
MKQYFHPYLHIVHTDLFADIELKIQKALTEHPEGSLGLHHQLALYLMHQKCENRSNRILASAQYIIDHAEDAEDTSIGYELMAICYECVIKDDAMAIQYFTTSIEYAPHNDSSMFSLAQIYMRKSEYEKALHYFKILQEQQPEDPSFAYIGECYLELNNFDEAQKNFEAALLERENGNIYDGLGRCAVEKGEADKAIEYFQLALKQDPDRYSTNYYLGLSYQNREDYYRALHYYNQAVKLWPDFSDALNNIAVCYECLGDDPEASLKYFERALQTDPPPRLKLLLYTNLARVHSKRKNFDQHEYYQQQVFKLLGFV